MTVDGIVKDILNKDRDSEVSPIPVILQKNASVQVNHSVQVTGQMLYGCHLPYWCCHW